eukprot:gene3535-7029_t
MFDGEYCRVHIRVRAETKFGEVVAIGGSVYPLGFFDKAKVIQLVTTPESYPVWYTAKPLVLPRQQLVHYKYCIVENGLCKSFENLQSPRNFSPDLTDTLVEDIFDVENLGENNMDSENSLLSELNALQIKGQNDSEKIKNIVKEKLYIVCYHLPLVVKRSPQSPGFVVSWSDSLIAKSSNDSVATIAETHWIGTLSVPGDAPTPKERDVLVDVLKSMNCIPVFISTDVAKAAYQGYCKEVLWPVFHNVDPLDHIHAAWRVSGSQTDSQCLIWNNETTGGWWKAFKTVNEACVNAVLSIVTPKDIIWVHDYHLMLMPKMLRDNKLANSVIFFLHIPFPTSQIFRSLTSATELLHSMTCADVIGFHTFDYGRHFLQATKRMLGYRSHTRPGGLLAITVGDREVN